MGGSATPLGILRTRAGVGVGGIIGRERRLVPTTPLLALARATDAFRGRSSQLHLQLRRRRMSARASESESESEAAVTESEKKGEGEAEAEAVVQYVVLRRDLIDEWPLGSVVTQGCHASVAAIWQHKDDPHTLLYCSPSNLPSMHKVTLEVKGQPQLVNLSEKLKASGISHHLWIEQPENFPTCLATKPYPKSALSPFFKRLKLCK